MHIGRGAMKKTCLLCGELLPLSDYTRDKNSPDGLVEICKDCMVIQRKSRQRKGHHKGLSKRSTWIIRNDHAIQYDNLIQAAMQNDINMGLLLLAYKDAVDFKAGSFTVKGKAFYMTEPEILKQEEPFYPNPLLHSPETSGLGVHWR
jgi:hypothetical protein